jgi:hypothetical protein
MPRIVISIPSSRRRPVPITNIYVNADGGSDLNPGTEESPLATLDAAMRRWGSVLNQDSTIHLYPHPDANGYTSRELFRPRMIRARAKIVGHGVETVAAGPFTISSNTNRVYTFSGSPGWTPGEFSKLDLEATGAGPTGIPVGQKRTIVWNTSNTITVCNRHVNDAFAAAASGDEFRIVRPGVVIDTTPPALHHNTIYGGQGRGDGRAQSGEMSSFFEIENVEMQLSQDIGITGAFELFGTHFTKSSSALRTVFAEDSVLHAGRYRNNDLGLRLGWGISLRDRAGGTNPHPAMTIRRSSAVIDYCGGGLRVENASRVSMSNGIIDGINRVNFPHGALYCRNGSSFLTDASAFLNLYVRCFTNEFSVENEQAFIEIYKPLHHLSAGAVCRARYQGSTVFGAAPVILGSLTTQSSAQQGGQVRLSGFDGSTFGEIRVGIFDPIVRDLAADPFTVAEAINGSESSCFYRSP